MVRVKAEVFGFDRINNQFAKYENNVEASKLVLEKHAKTMEAAAKSNAVAGGLRVTGQGVSGIQTEPTENGFNVGWASRPNFHLYFHELGFHAVDNRGSKQTIRRDLRGARKRRYQRVRATYVPATPHMRPAFKQNRDKFLYEMIHTIQD